MKNKKTQVQHYVNNEQFYTAILSHKQKVKEALALGKQEPRLSEYIGSCIQNIATRLSFSPNFINYSFRDEMIAEGIENCLEYFTDYDPEYLDKNGKSNPFTYFTQVCFWAFVRTINKEERKRYIKCKNFVNSTIGTESLYIDEENNNLLPHKTYDNIVEFIERYEEKERRKKEKKLQSIMNKGKNKKNEENENRSNDPSSDTGIDKELA